MRDSTLFKMKNKLNFLLIQARKLGDPMIKNELECFNRIINLKSNIKDIEARMNSVKKKLDNENFVKRAPENIVKHEQKKYINYKNNYDKLVENLNSLMS